MAVLCSQCGALIPRPDLSRTPLVCARCATARAAPSHDEDDMLTVDAPPPERASEPAPRASQRPSMAPSMPPSVRPPPGPTSVPRPSVRPPVGGPPGSRIPGGGSIPRATPSAAPRPLGTSVASGAIPKAPAVPSIKPGAPAPRPLPKPAPAHPARAGASTSEPTDFAPIETGDFEIVQAHDLATKPGARPPTATPEWDPDDEPTGDILLETGDFESLDPSVPRPRR